MTRLAVLALAAALAAAPAPAQTLRWAAGTDVATLDPHGNAGGFTLAFLGNVYEGLVRRAPDLSLEPALATGWRTVEPRVWRFTLREGVVFQDGSPFSAEDVAFSIARAKGRHAGARGRLAPIAEARVVDPRTVELVTQAPDPILPQALADVLIISRAWAERVGAAEASNPAHDVENAATRSANGTGPFRVTSREAGRLTVLVRNDAWWDTKRGSIVEVEFRPIAADATRLAALASGEVDLVMPVPVQDIPRLKATPGIVVLEGPALRTIFLGFDIGPVLKQGEAGGRNPLADTRVRRAIGHAIDAEAIRTRVMQGAATPAGLLWGPGVAGYTAAEDRRPVFDPARARALLAEAAYPEGFALTLDCPNDGYVHDEAICRAIAPMLARIGIRLTVNLMPRAQYLPKLARLDSSFFLLGWSADTYDAHHPLRFLVHARDPDRSLGTWNYTGYDRPEVNVLIEAIGQEFDSARRQALIDQAAAMLRADAIYLPLHHQTLAWAHRDRVRVVQRADDVVVLNWITLR
jgi:peptide/nickel transport system substrate-binding protein